MQIIRSSSLVYVYRQNEMGVHEALVKLLLMSTMFSTQNVEEPKIFKVKSFRCRSLKGGSNSGISVIYYDNVKADQIALIEVYCKNTQENEDRGRMVRFLESLIALEDGSTDQLLRVKAVCFRADRYLLSFRRSILKKQGESATVSCAIHDG